MRRWARAAHGVLALALALLLTGCIPSSFAATPYQQATGDASSLLAASATAIEQVHGGDLDRRYGRASLALYHTHLTELPGLASLRGAPGEDETRRLEAVMEDVTPIVADPCLDDGCDWRAQVKTLRDASTIFAEAGS